MPPQNDDFGAQDPQVPASGIENAPAEPVGSTSGRSKRAAAIVIALIVLIAIIIGCVWLIQRNHGSENAGMDQGTNDSAYVDDKGSQEHPLDAAPGESIGEMTLNIGGETAPVDPVQLTEDGMLIPPQDVQRLGWYSASAVPGAKGAVGSSVITGHVNYVGQGDGFAQKFASMSLGDKVKVSTGEGEVEFKVTEAPYLLPKGADFPEVINDETGPNRLVLITCGGDFVGGQLGYAENIIVVAEPV